MLKALKKLFDDTPAETPHAQDEQVHLAAATLLQELMRVDEGRTPDERAAAAAVLTDIFDVSPERAAALLAEGADKVRQLTSYYKPVAALKRAFSLECRVRFVEHLWRVAYADGRLDPYEDHFVRKIAHLLYVPNTQCMVGRSRARSALRSPASATPSH